MKRKKIRAGIACVMVILLLSGCATQPQAVQVSTRPTAEIVEGLRKDGIKPPRGTSMKWKQRTKGKVAGATVLATFSALMGGGQVPIRSGPRNAAPSEGYVDLAGNPTVFEAGEMLGFDDPAAAMAEALSRQLKASGIGVDAQGRYSVSPHASIWGIDYDKMGEEDSYRLYYEIYAPLSDGKTNVRYFRCKGVTQDKRSLDGWLANNKAEVRKAAAMIGDLCADEWLASLELVIPSVANDADKRHSTADLSH